jgi:Icc protein
MTLPQDSLYRIEPTADVVRVVQLTDAHLCESPGGTLLGMDTDHSLQSVIAQVQREVPQLDLVLGTGDLSDNGSGDAYVRVAEQFCRLTEHNFWLPGNHDDRAGMEAAVRHDHLMGAGIRAGNWQILLLDSQVPGQVGGRLGAAELARLEAHLQAGEEQDLHTLVCLHHQPVNIGCDWLDEQKVADADAFFEVLDRFERVRGVLWGHVHQEHDSLRGDVRLLASPSTCVQFAPGSARFKADDLPPGYRRLDLHPDGRIDTEVSRVWDVEFTVELDSGGYL